MNKTGRERTYGQIGIRLKNNNEYLWSRRYIPTYTCKAHQFGNNLPYGGRPVSPKRFRTTLSVKTWSEEGASWKIVMYSRVTKLIEILKSL